MTDTATEPDLFLENVAVEGRGARPIGSAGTSRSASRTTSASARRAPHINALLPPERLRRPADLPAVRATHDSMLEAGH